MPHSTLYESSGAVPYFGRSKTIWPWSIRVYGCSIIAFEGVVILESVILERAQLRIAQPVVMRAIFAII